MIKHLNKALMLLMVVPSIASANYTVSPVKVNIPEGSMMSSVNIHNNNSDTRRFQVRIYQTNKEKTMTHDEEARDLIVSPAMFKVDAGKDQMIRVAIKKSDTAFANKYYVLSVKEIAHGKDEKGKVKFLTDFRVPVILGADDTTVSVSDHGAAVVDDATHPKKKETKH